MDAVTIKGKTGKKPVVLCILDGWGIRTERENNAIALANTPAWDRMLATWPHGRLEASEEHVGLPGGQMGNSEVGHMNLGAGRVMVQCLPRIDAALAAGVDGTFGNADTDAGTIDVLDAQIDVLRKNGGTCHVMGLLSPGGVHAHQAHLLGLVRTVAAAGIQVVVHGFLDGRDTPPRSAAGFVADFVDALKDMGNVRLVSLCGRYFAMDRDRRWDRVSRACDLMVDGVGIRRENARDAVLASYDCDVRDEFVEPVVLGDYQGMRDGDAVLMGNFRADRTRQILEALLDPEFEGFPRKRVVWFSSCVGMVPYSARLDRFAQAMFPADQPENILGQVVSGAGLRQLRIAETEKYAHVTFFLNGGREQVFEGEDRILVPSPDVETYDLRPEMSASEVTDNLVQVIEDDTYDLIVVNFANGDMVGHTGILSAAIKAAETLDVCLARLEEAVVEANGVMLVTADHGNCECMATGDGGMYTAHTLNPVPAVLVNAPPEITELRSGRLCDVAPTLLQLIGVDKPVEMTGRTLIDGMVGHVHNTAAE